MENGQLIYQYFFRALAHKIKTPLATIKNDIEYIKTIYPNEDLESTDHAIQKINNVINDAFFTINMQEKNEEKSFNFKKDDFKNLLSISNDIENFTVNLNKNLFEKLISNIVNLLNTHNLINSQILQITPKLKDDNSTLFSVSFRCKTIRENEFLKKESFDYFFEYINKKNDIDSIQAILCDILIMNFSLKIKITGENENLNFEIFGF